MKTSIYWLQDKTILEIIPHPYKQQLAVSDDGTIFIVELLIDPHTEKVYLWVEDNIDFDYSKN